ncbi:dephospho-CoA kinase [Fundidesulfovibrio butyratiphilus]
MSEEILNETASGPARLDQFWTVALAPREVARARIQEWIKDGLATVEGDVVRKPSHKLRGGEFLGLTIPRVSSLAGPEAGSLALAYRDEHLLVCDKPAGLTVHPAPSCPEGTLVNRLLHHFPQLGSLAGERPGIVHRIDKDTSGLLVVALTEPVRLRLAQAFAKRQVSKTYLALVHGVPAKASATLTGPIGRDPKHKTRMAVLAGGRPAQSTYRVVWTSPDRTASLLEVGIATGRTHQIRVHMAAEGHPLLGDALYGPAEHARLKRERPVLAKLLGRQMLHAWKLAFTHPVTGEELAFTCPAPRDFWRVPLVMGRTLGKVGIVGLPGCGKSAVLAEFGRRGYPTWSADACIAELYQPGRDGWDLLRRRYGERFTPRDDAPVDKVVLLAAMRASDNFRREVMELLYPPALENLRAFWREHAGDRVAFAEVPMLLEAGWLTGGAVDFAIGVGCPQDVRHARLKTRGWDQATIDLVDGWQWTWEKKRAACRYGLDNSGTLEDLRAAVSALADTLRRERIAPVRALLESWRAGGLVAARPDVEAEG